MSEEIELLRDELCELKLRNLGLQQQLAEVPARRVLPQRRRAETFELEFGGHARCFAVTLGFYDDGALGEVFITGGKSGEQVEAIARDGAVLLSMALQHGCPVTTIASAITRDSQGAPSSIIGAVVDRLIEAPRETPT